MANLREVSNGARSQAGKGRVFSWLLHDRARDFRTVFILAGLGLLSWSARAVCTIPDGMKAQMQRNPSAEDYAKLGLMYGRGNAYECAASAFRTATDRDPRSAVYAYFLGLSLYSAGRDAAARDSLTRAADLDAKDVRPHLALGAVLDRMGRTEDAEKEWRTALDLHPGSAAALDGLSQVMLEQKDYQGVIALLATEKSTTRTPLQSLNLGIAYANRAQIQDARRVLSEGLDAAPDSLPLAKQYALVLMLLDRRDEAYAVFEQALARHPGDEATQLLYLRTLVVSRSERAMPLAKKMLARFPKQWEVLYLNGVLAEREGDSRQARSLLERSIALRPAYAPAHTALGKSLSGLGDLQDAKAEMEKGVRLGDDQPETIYDLGRVLRGLGETEAAKERLKNFQQIKEKQFAAAEAAGKCDAGDAAMATGDAQRAAHLYREAIASDPSEAILSYKLAKALERLGDVAGERAALEQAIGLQPDMAEAQNQLGYVVLHSGDAAQAEHSFRAAVQASPSYVIAWMNLAACLASEAKWQEAKSAVGHALEVDPTNAGAHRLEQAILAEMAH